jgi:multisubunit Na+/H+ antiporter MnhB subunit
MNWDVLISLRHSAVISRSSYGLFLVPAIALMLTYIEQRYTTFPEWVTGLRLPLNFASLYFSAVFATTAHFVVTWRCPKIIQELRTSFAIRLRLLEEIELGQKIRNLELVWEEGLAKSLKENLPADTPEQAVENIFQKIKRAIKAVVENNKEAGSVSTEEHTANALYDFKNLERLNKSEKLSRYIASILYATALLLSGYSFLFHPARTVITYYFSDHNQDHRCSDHQATTN